MIEGLKVLLRGGVAVANASALFTVERSLPHGHVAAVLGSARGCGAAVWFGSASQELQPLRLAKLKDRFGIAHLAWVGDRGMLTSARIEQVLEPEDMDWVSSLRAPQIAPQIAQLAEEHGPFQPSLFDERILLELTRQHVPGERLVVCRNPALAEERARKRLELLAATEADLAKITAAARRARSPLRGQDAVALRVARVVGRLHMAKHFELTITETPLAYQRKTEAIEAEAALDGLYVIRTSLPAARLDANATVAAYKCQAHVERAFRSIMTMDPSVRPVFHHSESRVRAHAFLCMLAYNVTRTHVSPATKIVVTTRPTPVQTKAFALLALNPARTQ